MYSLITIYGVHLLYIYLQNYITLFGSAAITILSDFLFVQARLTQYPSPASVFQWDIGVQRH